MIVRHVTDERVGEVGIYTLRRRRAEREASRLNAGDPLARPVEYKVERSGLGFVLVAYQAKLEEV